MFAGVDIQHKIDQGPFHVVDEGLDIDMLMTEIEHFTNDHGRRLALAAAEFPNPGPGQQVGDHFL